MNLDKIAKDKNSGITAEILMKVEAAFTGEPCKIWLASITRSQADEAASKLRSENRDWSFSIEEHGSSGSYLVIAHSHLAKSGEIGDH